MPKLVLLPGLDGSGRLFKPLLKQQSPEIETIILPYPNDRLMSHVDLCDFLHPRLPNEPFFILGESFGGPLAILLSEYAKDYVQGLILFEF